MKYISKTYIYVCVSVCIRLQARSLVPTPKRSRGVSPRAWMRFCRASLQAAAEPAERSERLRQYEYAIKGCCLTMIDDPASFPP